MKHAECICGSLNGICLCHKPDIDHKSLLLKFMKHVQEIEGNTFVDDLGSTNIYFRRDEIAELKNLQLDNDLRP